MIRSGRPASGRTAAMFFMNRLAELSCLDALELVAQFQRHG
jgi:hypothetical protein